MDSKEKIITLIFLVLGMTSLARTVFLLWGRLLPDFSVFYRSTLILFQHQNPYLDQRLFTQFNYPPTIIIFLLPLLLFSFSIASKIWLVLSIIFLLLTLDIFYKIRPVSLLSLVIIFAATVFSFPFKFTLGMGQINLIVLFLLSLLILFIKTKKEVAAGIILSFSAVIKLFPMIFLLYLFMVRRWQIILVTFSSLFILSLISFFYFGRELNFYYLQNILLPLLSKPAGGVYYNQSLTGFSARLNLSSGLTEIVRMVFIAGSVFLLFKKKFDVFLSVCILLALILLVNNFTWQHHLIFLLLPYYFILSHAKSKLTKFFVFISYFLVAFNFKNTSFFESTIVGNLILSHGFLGTLFLWILLLVYNEKEKTRL